MDDAVRKNTTMEIIEISISGNYRMKYSSYWWTDEMIERKIDMIKSVDELQSGMVCETRNGDIYIVLVDDKFKTMNSIDSRYDILSYMDLEKYEGMLYAQDKDYDIINVFKRKSKYSFNSFKNKSLAGNFELIYKEPKSFKCLHCNHEFTNDNESENKGICVFCRKTYNDNVKFNESYEMAVLEK